jgi:hypothetical protein
VRSLLLALERLEGAVRVTELPPNLYEAARELLEAGRGATATIELPDGDRVAGAVEVTRPESGWQAVAIDLGPVGVLDRLGGGDAEELVSALGALAASGGRTLSADFTVLSREAAATPRAWQREVETGFRPDPSLLLLWARITLWEAVAHLRDQAARVEEQWDGSLLIVPQHLRPAPTVNTEELLAAMQPSRYAREASAALALLFADRLDELVVVTEITDRDKRQRALRELLASVEVDPATAEAIEAAGAQIEELARRILRDAEAG